MILTMNIIIQSKINKYFTFIDLFLIRKLVLSMTGQLDQLYQLTETFHSC
jgi:hypothetical protein